MLAGEVLPRYERANAGATPLNTPGAGTAFGRTANTKNQEMRECDQIENRHESQHQQISRDAPRARERKAIISTIQARQEEKRPAVLYRRIGSTNYKVTIHFDDAGGETMTDKILHMVKNEGLDFEPGRGMMDVPQMSRQPEGSTQ